MTYQDRWQNNLGVGGTVLAEAGAQNRFREDEFIFNHSLVLTPSLLSQFRILLGRYGRPRTATCANRESSSATRSPEEARKQTP